MQYMLKILKRLWRRFRGAEEQPHECQWSRWAHKLPRSAFIIWLAGHVADDLLMDQTVSIDDLIAAVNSNSTGWTQNKAERFIENYYFGCRSIETTPKLICVFRKMITRKLLHSSHRELPL